MLILNENAKCGNCQYLKWDRSEHKNYCSNKDSWEYNARKQHYEGCNMFKQKKRVQYV